jgi:hypothetical protein
MTLHLTQIFFTDARTFIATALLRDEKIRRGLDFCSASSQPHSASAILRPSIPDGTNGVPLLTKDRPLYHL